MAENANKIGMYVDPFGNTVIVTATHVVVEDDGDSITVEYDSDTGAFPDHAVPYLGRNLDELLYGEESCFEKLP